MRSLRVSPRALELGYTRVRALINNMAEVGNMELPARLLQRGVKDMVRISDARMSGTAYGTVVLHVCPEAAVGGPLALVKDGDMICLNVEARTLHLEVRDEELQRRAQEIESGQATGEPAENVLRELRAKYS